MCRRLIALCVGIALAATSAQATVILKANNATNLNLGGSWAGGVVPGGSDVGKWDSTVTGANTTVLGGDLSWQGIEIANPGGLVTVNAGNTLTLGTSGIDMSTAMQNLTLNNALTLGAGQAWTVAGSRTLTAAGAIDGTGPLTKTGAGTLTLTGNNAYTGATTVSQGVLSIAHSNALGSTAGGTTINTGSARLDLSGGITVAEPITLTGGSLNTSLQNVSGTNTLTGLLTTSSARIRANTGTTLNITGGVTGTNPQLVVNAANGTINFTTNPLNLGTSGIFWCDSGGLTVLGVAGNTWGGTTFTSGTLRMGVANALPSNTLFRHSGLSYGTGGTLDLNGFDQTVASLYTGPDLNPARAAGSQITSATPATFTVNQGGNTTYAGGLTGAVSLVKSGAGTLNLTASAAPATNHHTGDTVVNGGTLAIGDVGILRNSTLDTGASGSQQVTFTVAGTNTYNLGGLKGADDLAIGSNTISVGANGQSTSYSGVIGSTGALTKTGAGTLTLTGNNAYTGATTVTGGTLVVQNATGFNSSTDIANGATLDVNLTTEWHVPSITFTGTGTLVKSGSGTMIAGRGGHTYVSMGAGGLIDIRDGVLRNDNRRGYWSANQASMNIESAGELWLYADNVHVDALTGTGKVYAKYSDTNDVLFVGVAGGSGTFSGTMANGTRLDGSPAGSLNVTKQGGGTQTLAGAQITYTGATTVNTGTLALQDTTGFGSASTVNAVGSLNLNKTVDGFAARSKLTGLITGSGTINVNNATPGIGGGWVIFNSPGVGLNNFTGTVNVNSGVLAMDNILGTWSGNPDLNVVSGGIFAIRAQNISVDALTGNGDVINSWNGHGASGDTLTVGANNGSGTFSGVIHGSVATGGTDGTLEQGILNLVKTGSGTQTLTGANTYTGSTTISGGTLQIGSPALPVTSGLQLWLDAADGASVIRNNGLISQWQDKSGNGRHVNQTNAADRPNYLANTTTDNPGVYFDGHDVMANTYDVDTPYTIYSTSNLNGTDNQRLITSTLNNWLLGYWNGNEDVMFAEGWVKGSVGPTPTTDQHYYAAAGDGSQTWFYEGTTQLANNASGKDAPNGISLGAWKNNPDSESSAGYVSEIVLFNRVLNAAERQALSDYLAAKWGEGVIPNGSAVTVSAPGTLDLNNYGETIGSLAGDGTVSLGAGMLITGANNGTTVFSGNMTGAGDFQKIGTGEQTLSGTGINYTGHTTVTGGTLRLTNATAFNSSIANSATVEINATSGDSWVLNINKSLSGAGTWIKTGSGRASFRNTTLTTTGQFLIQQGTLRNDYNSSNWSASTADIDISSGAILDLYADAIYVDQLTGSGFVQNNYGNSSGYSGASQFIEKLVVGVANGSSTFDGVIRNNSSGTAPAAATAGGGVQLEKTGTGTFTLTGNNTYTGTTTISRGTLLVDGDHAGGGMYTVGSGATLGGSGTTGPVTVDGTVAPGTSTGILQTGTVQFNDGSTFAVELNGTTVETEYDQLDVTGSVTLAGTLDASLGYEPSYFDKLFIIRNDGTDPVVGTFDGLDDHASLHLSHGGVDGLFWISYQGDWDTGSITGGNDVVLVAVPEPATLTLLGLGGLLLAARRRRR